MIRFWSVESDPAGQGRLAGAKPVAVLDIGSNSVRLVVYERLARALTVLYNEKSSSTLGRGVAASGKLAETSVASALKAIRRFALVCRLTEVGEIYAIATSATREASNGPEFARAVEEIIGVPVRVLSGEEEAHFAAYGIVAGMPDFKGVVGDLGGGSLELAQVEDGEDTGGETHELGVIRLQDDSNMSSSKAVSIIRERLQSSKLLEPGKRKTFGAIGGTWRSLAKLHQARCQYSLHMVQDYAVPAAEIISLCDELVSGNGDKKLVKGIETVSGSRKDLLPFGAAVLAEVLRAGKFEEVVFSALGVREGYLFDILDEGEKAIDPLLQAAEEISLLRSRAPEFSHDLIVASKAFFDLVGVSETQEETRLREAACFMSDIGWRAHPDYRGEQSIQAVAFSDIVGVSHAGRAFLARTLAFRYMGFKQKSPSAKLLDLTGSKLGKRSKLLAAYFRVAYPLAAAMPGIIPRTYFAIDGKTLVLHLPSDLAFLDGDRIRGRHRQLASEAGFKDGTIQID
ncbi:Ppx/GppA family phosphatase [Pelagibacterium luteolum]|uniref:Exopolyphosphatase / guanosine-5'-triphosphate,3'-diphosphate pyrophosphatase n=1 Tax=Pelagibacterium luteolum TaxID=440168 RepID=A0A1G7X2F4_9HYPH|nr:Ppx/GppA family phosphatase [Pelagibacterium luteolum]SDG78359.1 exopolyphosphatase / guanosine-5'-triphosphate,3'-diphosphate pyrophosphatase [Pelagibacterium luteolum]